MDDMNDVLIWSDSDDDDLKNDTASQQNLDTQDVRQNPSNNYEATMATTGTTITTTTTTTTTTTGQTNNVENVKSSNLSDSTTAPAPAENDIQKDIEALTGSMDDIHMKSQTTTRSAARDLIRGPGNAHIVDPEEGREVDPETDPGAGHEGGIEVENEEEEEADQGKEEGAKKQLLEGAPHGDLQEGQGQGLDPGSGSKSGSTISVNNQTNTSPEIYTRASGIVTKAVSSAADGTTDGATVDAAVPAVDATTSVADADPVGTIAPGVSSHSSMSSPTASIPHGQDPSPSAPSAPSAPPVLPTSSTPPQQQQQLQSNSSQHVDGDTEMDSTETAVPQELLVPTTEPVSDHQSPVAASDGVKAEQAKEQEGMTVGKDEAPTPKEYHTDDMDFDEQQQAIRYFLMRCSKQSDLEDALQTSTWPTNPVYDDTLRKAYNPSVTIYLIFTLRGTREFGGIAKMASEICWLTKRTIFDVSKFRQKMRLEWIASSRVSYDHIIKELRLPGYAVIRSNGQELRQDLGRYIYQQLTKNVTGDLLMHHATSAVAKAHEAEYAELAREQERDQLCKSESAQKLEQEDVDMDVERHQVEPEVDNRSGSDMDLDIPETEANENESVSMVNDKVAITLNVDEQILVKAELQEQSPVKQEPQQDEGVAPDSQTSTANSFEITRGRELFLPYRLPPPRRQPFRLPPKPTAYVPPSKASLSSSGPIRQEPLQNHNRSPPLPAITKQRYRSPPPKSPTKPRYRSPPPRRNRTPPPPRHRIPLPATPLPSRPRDRYESPATPYNARYNSMTSPTPPLLSRQREPIRAPPDPRLMRIVPADPRLAKAMEQSNSPSSTPELNNVVPQKRALDQQPGTLVAPSDFFQTIMDDDDGDHGYSPPPMSPTGGATEEIANITLAPVGLSKTQRKKQRKRARMEETRLASPTLPT
ncbi:3'-5' RNA helicase ythdc2 [Haplosporangium sp. Z 767]|nr:3'-5' RNA helicase ythdc2 [Haplosporangium sp. Z 767]